MKPIFRFTVLLVLIVAGVGGYSFHWYHSKNSNEPQEILFNIESGTGFKEIVAQLHEGGFIAYPYLYKAIVVAQGQHKTFKAGEYSLPYNASPAELTRLLASGKVVVHSVTIPEGWTVAQVRDLLIKEDRLEGELPADIEEGSLLPDTYHIHRGDQRSAVIGRMQRAMEAAVNEAWAQRQDDVQVSSPQELVVLASMIEKETGVHSERERVSAVFNNRLRIGMKLQSDPTVVYGIEKVSGPMGRALLRVDLQKDHPYNTYTREGLPPKPIANPGKAALKAAAQPITSDELYFVATGTGGHRFATNLADHNRNVAAYRRAIRQQ